MKTEMATCDVSDAIFQRRAVRHYTEREVDPALVRKLLSAAVQAPSALNQQPWAFAVFHGHKRLRSYSDRAKRHLMATYPTTFEAQLVAERYSNPNYDLFHQANTLLVIYSSRGRFNPNEDCCLAAENLMLAAHGLGLGTCPIGFARDWLDLPETKREFGIADCYHAVFPLVVGYPAEQPPAVERKAPEIVCWVWDASG